MERIHSFSMEEQENLRIGYVQSQGICIRTATRWNDFWQQQGLVQKIRHGFYKKTA